MQASSVVNRDIENGVESANNRIYKFDTRSFLIANSVLTSIVSITLSGIVYYINYQDDKSLIPVLLNVSSLSLVAIGCSSTVALSKKSYTNLVYGLFVLHAFTLAATCGTYFSSPYLKEENPINPYIHRFP